MQDSFAPPAAARRMPFSGPRTTALHALSLAVVAAVIAATCAALVQREHELRRAHAAYLAASLSLWAVAEVERLVQPGWPDQVLPTDQKAAQAEFDAGDQAAPGAWQVAVVRVGATAQRWTVLRRRASPGETPELRSLPQAGLQQTLASLDLGPLGAATVRTEDLALVHRHAPGVAEHFKPGSRNTSQALQDIARQRSAHGHFEATTALDGIPRINAYRRSNTQPLYVLVGVPTSDYPHGWNRADAFLALASLALMAGALWVAGLHHRLARQAQKSLSLQYAAIVDNASDAIVSKQLDGTVVSWNAAATRLFGWTADDMVGRNISTLIPEDLRHEEETIVQGLRRGEVVAALETERLHKNGHRIPVSITISPVRSPYGEVIGASKIARDITRQKSLEKEIRALALEDALTKLPNRRLLEERLAQTLLWGGRSQAWSGLFMIDVDDFKLVNDRWGHEVGDQLLVEVGQRIRHAVRDVDTVARLGGDEFVVLCQGLGPTEAEAQAHLNELQARLLAEVELPWPCPTTGLTWTPRISAGPSLISPQDKQTAEVLHRADVRMYEVKRGRKGR